MRVLFVGLFPRQPTGAGTASEPVLASSLADGGWDVPPGFLAVLNGDYSTPPPSPSII